MQEVNNKQPMLVHPHLEIETTFLIVTKQLHLPLLHFYLPTAANNFGYIRLTFSLMVHGICTDVFLAVNCFHSIEVGFAVMILKSMKKV